MPATILSFLPTAFLRLLPKRRTLSLADKLTALVDDLAHHEPITGYRHIDDLPPLTDAEYATALAVYAYDADVREAVLRCLLIDTQCEVERLEESAMPPQETCDCGRTRLDDLSGWILDHDWYGDPSIPSGTRDFYVRRAACCGDEIGATPEEVWAMSEEVA